MLRLADYQQPAAATAADASLRLAANLPGGPSDAAIRWLTSPQRPTSSGSPRHSGSAGT